jgi:hypothetical protein
MVAATRVGGAGLGDELLLAPVSAWSPLLALVSSASIRWCASSSVLDQPPCLRSVMHFGACVSCLLAQAL